MVKVEKPVILNIGRRDRDPSDGIRQISDVWRECDF